MRLKTAQLRLIATYAAICGLPLLVVLGFFPVTTLGFELPKFFALSAASLVAGLWLVFNREQVLPYVLGTTSAKAFVALVAVLLLSPLWSVAPLLSTLGASPRYQGVLTYACLITIALCSAKLTGKKKTARVLLHGLLVSNVAIVFYGLLQMLQLDPFASLWLAESFLGRVFSTLGHPNAFAQAIVLTLPFVCLQWVKANERTQRLWWLAVIISNCTVLFATASRSGLVALIALVILCLPPLKRFVQDKRSSIKPEQAFALSLVTVLLCSLGFVYFLQRFSSSYEVGRSTSARLEIWETATVMFGGRPIGWGLETMSFVTPRFLTKDIYASEALTVVIDRPHNIALLLLNTVGPLGFIAYVWLIVSLLYAAWQHRQGDKEGLHTAAAAGVFAFQITLLFGFASIATTFLFWVLLGVCLSLSVRKPVPISRSVDAATRYLLTALCTVSLVVSVQWMQARLIHAHARTQWSVDPGQTLAFHQQGLLTFGYDREMLVEAAESHLLIAQQTEENAELLQSVEVIISMLERLTSGQDGTVHTLQAWAYALHGEDDMARNELAMAQPYFYQSIVFHRAVAHIYELLEDGPAVYEQESKIRALLPDAYFEEGSETRRILLKQHPWLETL